MSHLPIVPAQCFAVAVRTGEPSPKEAMKKTLTEAELRQLVAEGRSQKEIGLLLGCKQSYVSAACKILGIAPANPKFAAKSRIDPTAYLDDMRKGLTIAEIAEKHGKCANAVVQALKRAGLPTCARKLLRHEAAQQAA